MNSRFVKIRDKTIVIVLLSLLLAAIRTTIAS